jgi:hypothetical protein
MKSLYVVITVLSAVYAVDQFYTHPTYGRGLKALAAVIQAGEFLG